MANRKSVEDYEKILKTREVRRKEQFLFYLVDSEGLWKATPAGEQLLGVWPEISSIFDEKKVKHIVIKIEVDLNLYVILVVCCIPEEASSDRRIKLRLIPERWEEGKKHFYDKYGPVKTHILMTQLDSITNIPTNFSLWRGWISRCGQEEPFGPIQPTPTSDAPTTVPIPAALPSLPSVLLTAPTKSATKVPEKKDAQVAPTSQTQLLEKGIFNMTIETIIKAYDTLMLL